MRAVIALGVFLTFAATAMADSLSDYDASEAERRAYNADQRLYELETRQQQLEDQMRRNQVDDYRPTYVPYGGYQDPYRPGPYIGTGR